MSVLDRSELEQSHLADLHAIAAELGIEGYRRLGRNDLIDSILREGGGETETGGSAPAADEADEPPAPAGEQEQAADAPPEQAAAPGRPRGRRLRQRRGREHTEEAASVEREADAGGEAPEVVIPEGDDGESAAPEADAAPERGGGRERNPGRERNAGRDRDAGRKSSGRRRSPDPEDDGGGDDEGEPRSGVLDILPGGSGFMRADAFVHSREDVYVSPAQIRRCELRAGDEISGPARPPRRSERYPSLVRVETINGAPADDAVERPSFDDLTPTFATEPLETIHGLPLGKGSRVAIGGPPGAGATRLLREVTDALEGDLDVLVVLAGVRPEEVTEWRHVEGLKVAGGGFDRPPDELGQIADMAVERAKRIVERGGDAVLIVDGLDALPPSTARRVFGAARKAEEGGSLTIVAATGVAGELQRLATTRVVLTAEGGLDVAASGTLRAELLGG